MFTHSVPRTIFDLCEKYIGKCKTQCLCSLVSVRLNSYVRCNAISYMSSKGKNLFSIQEIMPSKSPHQDKKDALEYIYIVLFSPARNHSLCKMFVYLKPIFSLSPIKHCSFYF